MKVTPLHKPFGKYKVGDEFELPDKAARVFIKIGKLEAVKAQPTYQTRSMQAEATRDIGSELLESVRAVKRGEIGKVHVIDTDVAPYGYKADGSPRKAPGRPTKAAD